MAQGGKLGLQFGLGGGPVQEQLAIAREAESLGYDSLWVAEVAGPDALVSLGALALNTSKVDLATGVIPIQIRTPGAMAMSFITINEFSGGRAIAGLGVSSPIIVERWHGASYDRPLTAMRECVTIMRQLFTEGRAKFDGKVYRSDFRLGIRQTAPRRPRIYMGSLNPPMLRLAGEIADGVLLNYTPPEAVPEMIEEIHEGAHHAHRDPNSIDIGIYARMCVTPDEAEAIAAFKRELATYAFVKAYIDMFSRYGMAQEFAEVRKLWQAGKREEAPMAISDASARKIAAFGTPEAGRGFIARCREAGITHPVVFPIGPGATRNRDYLATMRALVGA